MAINRTTELALIELHDHCLRTARLCDRNHYSDVAHSLFGIAGELEGWERYLRCLRSTPPVNHEGNVLHLPAAPPF